MAEKKGTGSLELVNSPDSVQPTEATCRTETESTTASEVEVIDLLPDSNSQKIKRKGTKPGTKRGKYNPDRKPYIRTKPVTDGEIGMGRQAKVMDLSIRGLSNQEISEITAIPPDTINHILSTFNSIQEEISNIDKYRQSRADIIDATYFKVMKSLSSEEKISKANLYQAAMAADFLYKQSRLEQGLSTENKSVQFTKVEGKYSNS